MAKPSRFKPVNVGANGWRLNVPKALSATGKRQQLFFKTRALAEGEAARLKGEVKLFGEQARAISPSLAEAAAEATRLLEPFGVGIVEAAKYFAAVRKREAESRPLDAAADEWILTCEAKELRCRTLASYKATVKKLKSALGSRVLATLTTADLQGAIAPPGSAGTAIQVHIRNARAFWLWAVKMKWCQKDAFMVSAPLGNRDREIKILAPDAARCLLETAARFFPQAVPLYAVQLFAGVRAQEVTLLQSEDVTVAGIELSASIAKKRRRRHIELNPTLAAWLKKYPFEPVSNWPRVDAACRLLAGWDLNSSLVSEMVASGRLDMVPRATRGQWPQNCLRHSHATYAIACGNIELKDLLFEFGHSGGEDLLRTNYVGLASKITALEYFAIVPPGTNAPRTIKPLRTA